MKALTIKQPWADAIAHGEKRVENRSWPAPQPHIGTRILIHAGASYDPMGRFTITDRDALNSWPDTRGAILAVATITGCHLADRGCCEPWGFPHEYHWQLNDVAPLTTPVPCPGRLKLWTPPADAINAAISQAEVAR